MDKPIQVGPFTVQWDQAHGELIMIGLDCQPVLSGEDTQALLGYLYDRKDDIYRATHANDEVRRGMPVQQQRDQFNTTHTKKEEGTTGE